MRNFDLFSIILVLSFAAILAYRASFLHQKKLFRLSLLQIFYLVVAPGIVFVMLYSYVRSIVQLPRVRQPFLSDNFLVSGILLSAFYFYGGLAIHAVTKMLSETALRSAKSEVAQLNKYFHLKFSHNLLYCGPLAVLIFTTLLELNHTPQKQVYDGLMSPVLRGLIVGVMFVVSIYNYTHSKDEYFGRLSDLKVTFISIWLGLLLMAYAVWRLDPAIKAYHLLLPMLSALTLLAAINMGLLVRWWRRNHKLKNGRTAVHLNWRRLFERE